MRKLIGSIGVLAWVFLTTTASTPIEVVDNEVATRTLNITNPALDNINSHIKELLAQEAKEELRLIRQEIIELERLELKRVEEERLKREKYEEEKKQKEYAAASVSRGSTKKIPNKNSNMKSYMSYKAVTNKSSQQYKLLNSSQVRIDNQGFLRIGESFVIAVGQGISNLVGQRLEVELESGVKFKAVIGDLKANIHTDSENIQHKVDKSVVEFIVDTPRLEGVVRKMGDCSHSNANNFAGNVVSIRVLD